MKNKIKIKKEDKTYAELEYGVTLEQLKAKADEIEERGCREINSGKATEVL